MSNENKVLTPEQVYFIDKMEARIKEFQEVNWANTKKELAELDARRQQLVTALNQIEGAIIGGQMMIQEELAKAGVTFESYQSYKNAKALEEKNNVIEFPNKGQEDETSTRTDDDSGSGDAE